MRRTQAVALAIVTALASSGALASQTQRDKSVEQGRVIVSRDCGSCHATGRLGRSAMPPAPPFRTLGERYPVDGLAEALAEGISVGHPAMPQLAYPEDQVAAIIAYLNSIQVKTGPRRP